LLLVVITSIILAFDSVLYSKNPDIHFKYIEVAVKTGHITEVERVTRESCYYDAEKTKNFLMKTNLPNARPLINVCDRFGFVPHLIHYLYSQNMLHYVEEYVQRVFFIFFVIIFNFESFYANLKREFLTLYFLPIGQSSNCSSSCRAVVR